MDQKFRRLLAMLRYVDSRNMWPVKELSLKHAHIEKHL